MLQKSKVAEQLVAKPNGERHIKVYFSYSLSANWFSGKPISIFKVYLKYSLGCPSFRWVVVYLE